MWNQRVLAPPPTCSFKVTLTQELRGKLHYIQGQLGNGKSDLMSHLSVLASEQYVQDRMIYKLNSQFRSEKSLKHMKQARVCLNRLKELDLQRQLEDLIATFTVNLQEEECVYRQEEEFVYLPSKQALQYYLVRLMSTAALLSRTCQLLKETYFYAKQLMEIGNMLSQNLMLIAISARLWVTCKSLKSCVSVWYQALYPLLELLQETPIQWLQSDSDSEETLPPNLTSWLQSQFAVDSSKDDDSMMTRAADYVLTFSDNDSEEELVSHRTDKLSLGMTTEDIGEPIQRKTREDISDQVEPTDQQDFSDQVEPTDQEDISDQVEPTDQHFVSSDNLLSVNRLPVDQNRQSEDEEKSYFEPSGDAKQCLNKRKVKKHLEKKLKTLIRIVKTLKMIKHKSPVQVGFYEFETTAEFRQIAKQMLGTCRQFMKENPNEYQISKKKSENGMAVQFQKMLVDKLLELACKPKQKLCVDKTVDDPLNNTTRMQHKLSNEDTDLTDVCNENDVVGEFDSNACITRSDKIHEVSNLHNISSGDLVDTSSCGDLVDTGSKVKRQKKKSSNNKSKKKKEKMIKESNESEKVESVPVDDRVKMKKIQHDNSCQEDYEQRPKSGKKWKSKKECFTTDKYASDPGSVLKQKRKQIVELEVPKKKRKTKGDKQLEKNKKKKGNKESKLKMSKRKRNVIK